MRPDSGAARRSPRSLLGVLFALVTAVLVGGCGGGGTYSVNEGQIAQRFIPTERSVDHHPDSLRAFTITEGEKKIQYQVKQDYQSVLIKWSSRFRNVGVGRSGRSRTYATFRSLELSLMSLQPDVGILSLQKERARKLIEEQREEYFDRIRIDVYWFVEGQDGGVISGPSARTELLVGDEAYRPVRTDHGPLREAFVAGDEKVLYRRNMLYFPRTVDGTDILENASGMRLKVRRVGTQSVEQFEWQWRND